MRYFIMMFFITALAGCKATHTVSRLALTESDSVEYRPVEFTRLAANLEAYDGQYIETSGAYYAAPEQSLLYSLADTAFAKSAIWIRFDERLSFTGFFTKKEQVNAFIKRVAVKIRGRVALTNRGHMGGQAGSIVEITYVEKL